MTTTEARVWRVVLAIFWLVTVIDAGWWLARGHFLIWIVVIWGTAIPAHYIITLTRFINSESEPRA